MKLFLHVPVFCFIKIICSHILKLEKIKFILFDLHILVALGLALNGSRLVVAAIYRSPSISINTFITDFTELLDLMPLQCQTIIIGDFNDNLVPDTSSTLVNFMLRLGFKQYVYQPTTDYRTCIDHIYYNRVDEEAVIDVHDTYYSDHDAVFITTNTSNLNH